MADGAEYGLVGDSGVPQPVADAQEWAMGLGERLWLPAGRIIADRPILENELPANVPFQMSGQGAGSNSSSAAITSLVIPEWGPGVRALDPSTGAYEWYISDMTIVGPSRSASWGQLPADVDGVFMDTKGLMERVNIIGFKSNLLVGADHLTLRQVNSNGGGYNLNFPPLQSRGVGDLIFDNMNLEGGKLASVGVSSQGVIANARFLGGHIGASPVAFERYYTNEWAEYNGEPVPGVPLAQRKFLDWVTFLHTSFENSSHGYFLDNAQTQHAGTMADVFFFPNASSVPFNNEQLRSDLPRRATFDVPTLSNIVWWGKPPYWDQNYRAVRAQQITGLQVYPDYGAMMSTVVNGTGPLPIELVPGSTDPTSIKGVHFGALPGSHQGGIQVAKALTTLKAFDLLEFDGAGNVRTNTRGMAGDIAGINGRACAAGAAAHYIVQGATAAVKINNYGPSIPSGSLIGPDPARPGGIQAVSNVKDSIGRARQTIPTNVAGEVDLTGIRYDVPVPTPPGFAETIFPPGRRLRVENDGLHALPIDF
jgi:hypothetical protein